MERTLPCLLIASSPLEVEGDASQDDNEGHAERLVVVVEGASSEAADGYKLEDVPVQDLSSTKHLLAVLWEQDGGHDGRKTARNLPGGEDNLSAVLKPTMSKASREGGDICDVRKGSGVNSGDPTYKCDGDIPRCTISAPSQLLASLLTRSHLLTRSLFFLEYFLTKNRTIKAIVRKQTRLPRVMATSAAVISQLLQSLNVSLLYPALQLLQYGPLWP